MAQGIESGRDGLLGLDRGFSFGGSLGKIVCTKIGGSAFERVREAISGGGGVGGGGGVDVAGGGGVGVGKGRGRRVAVRRRAGRARGGRGRGDPREAGV